MSDDSHTTIRIPSETPVMTLPGTVFFPGVNLPLHIFEPRYRQMLKDALNRDRLFAVAALDQFTAKSMGRFEPPFDVATIGVIRACQENDDGTSNLVIRGLSRIRIKDIAREEPYRLIRIEPQQTTAGAPEHMLHDLRQSLEQAISTLNTLTKGISEEAMRFLNSVQEPDAFCDLAAFSLCPDIPTKQGLLETLNTAARYRALIGHLAQRNERLKLEKQLQGNLDDDDIMNN